MFCTNCGSKLPDGCRFCSVCGTRLVQIEQAVQSEKPVQQAPVQQAPVEEREVFRAKAETVTSKPSGRVSFDWSNVVDEPHKKVIPDVPSPWESTGLKEEPVIDTTPSADQSRTLSFIEMLKQEREEKLRAADMAAEPVTAKEEIVSDYTPFEEGPSFYVPPMYDDITRTSDIPTERAPIEEPIFEKLTRVEPEISIEDTYLDGIEFAVPKAEPTQIFEPAPAAEQAPIFEPAPAVEPTQIFEPAPAVEPTQIFEPAPVAEPTQIFEPAPVAEESYAPAFDSEKDVAAGDLESLSAQLDSILSGAYTAADTADKKSTEDMYIDMADQYLEPAPAVEEEPVFEPAPVVEAAPVFEPALDEEEAPITLEDIIPEEPSKDAFEKKATIAAPADNESEIEALKRRLAELMGTPVEPEEVAPKETVTEEEIFAAAAATPEVEEPVVAETSDDDVLSLDELEKDLFGEITSEEIEAETTKKIDKFYTLYKKNEEFQRLLDEEYNKLKAAEDGVEAEAEAEAVPAEAVAVKEEVPAIEDEYDDTAVVVEEPVIEEVPAVEEPIVAEAAPILEDAVEEGKAGSVEDLLDAYVPVATPVDETVNVAAEIPAEDPKPVAEAVPAAVTTAAVEVAADKTEKVSKRKVKARKLEIDEDEDEKGGGFLTVLAVVIAILLVILLAVILILNFAPDSAIAMKIDAVIENVASYFTVVDGVNTTFML
ncbi:MAG: zinc-ribbon domain-containing protein [Mogibacterium sp.]|nr:zinc-ribbon domain-containing protein [Mogibacterium sp.]